MLLTQLITFFDEYHEFNETTRKAIDDIVNEIDISEYSSAVKDEIIRFFERIHESTNDFDLEQDLEKELENF